MNIIRAVAWDGENLQVVRHQVRDLQPGEVRIRTILAGICNTDMELIAGYKGFRGRLGHEFVGEVIEGASEWVGQRVAVEINIICVDCDMCRRGIASQCRNRRAPGIDGGDVDGAFADSFCLPAENLHVVPENAADEAAVFTEPLAASCQILEQVNIEANDRVVLIGAGKLGMLCAQVIQTRGADLSVIVKREKQRDLLEKWGIRAVGQESVPDGMADYVVDCTGSVEGFNAALQLVRPRGTIILKSTVSGMTPADLTAVAVREIQIVGSRCGPFDKALHLLQTGQMDVLSMIDGEYPLDDAPAAFEHAAQRGVLKILLRP